MAAAFNTAAEKITTKKYNQFQEGGPLWRFGVMLASSRWELQLWGLARGSRAGSRTSSSSLHAGPSHLFLNCDCCCILGDILGDCTWTKAVA
mmetsp:Transcript_90894/g.190043  ORF Transcript_90894/g.190043 Transcript_90894/m.190043 type:complete len:92 (+) Transcript_90894:194-469(+)